MDSDTTTASALGLVRHILTYAGGILVAYGYLSQDQSAALLNDAMQALGALLGIGAVLWSIRNKVAHAKALAAAAGATQQTATRPGPLGPKIGAIVALIAAGLWLQACAATGGSAQPLTPRETLAKIEASYTVAVQTAADAITNHLIAGDTIAKVASADKFAGAALDNADTLILAASEPTATQADQDNAAKALQVAQTAVASLLMILQQQQPGSK